MLGEAFERGGIQARRQTAGSRNRPERLFAPLGQIYDVMASSVPRRLGRALRTFVGVPVRLQTYRNLGYLALAFPLGLAYFVALSAGLPTALVLSPFLVGVPILLAVLAGVHLAAVFERWLAVRLLGVEVDPPQVLHGDRYRDRARSLVTSPATWTATLFLAAKFLVGTVALVVLSTALSTGVAMLFVPLHYDEPGLYVGLVTDRPVEIHQAVYLGWDYLLVGTEAALTIEAWRIDTFGQALVVALAGLLLCLLTLHALNALARVVGWFAALTLGGAYDLLDVTGTETPEPGDGDGGEAGGGEDGAGEDGAGEDGGRDGEGAGATSDG